jgi:hypothetical protein
MILSMVGAQLAARRRAGIRPDLLESRSEISIENLLELEPDTRVVNDALLSAAAGHATFLALVGNPTGALELLTWAETRGHASTFTRTTLTRAWIVRGIAAWKQRDPRAFLTASATAFALSPPLMLRLITRGAASSVRLFGNRMVDSRQERSRFNQHSA